MLYHLKLSTFSILPLLFTIGLAKRHVLHNKINKYYISASCLTIILLLLEISVTLLANESGMEFIIWHKLVNIIGFSLSPIVPYLILIFISDAMSKYGIRSVWSLLAFANVVICILTFWTEWIFSIDLLNQYHRGELFFIPTSISMIYFLIICYEISKNRAKFRSADKITLMMIFLLPVASTVVQIVYPQLLIIWPSTSMSLLLYYIFTLELQYDFDVQTKIKNRSAFEKKLKLYENRKNATLFAFDLNHLKQTNDLYGHAEGDVLIKTTAQILSRHFKDFGEVFRIGGDEFYAVCSPLTDFEATHLLKELIDDINRTHLTIPIKLSLAYGFSHYNIHVDSTISIAQIRADDAMYANKARMKNRSDL